MKLLLLECVNYLTLTSIRLCSFSSFLSWHLKKIRQLVDTFIHQLPDPLSSSFKLTVLPDNLFTTTGSGYQKVPGPHTTSTQFMFIQFLTQECGFILHTQ